MSGYHKLCARLIIYEPTHNWLITSTFSRLIKVTDIESGFRHTISYIGFVCLPEARSI